MLNGMHELCTYLCSFYFCVGQDQSFNIPMSIFKFIEAERSWFILFQWNVPFLSVTILNF